MTARGLVSAPFPPSVPALLEDAALLARLHPTVAGWVERTFNGRFTEAQRLCVPAIQDARSVLLLSPTGSGKTLAGFLGVIDALVREREAAPGGRVPAGIRAIYVSPLRALTYDIQKNLERPLREMGLLDEETDEGGRMKDEGRSRTGDAASARRPSSFIPHPSSLPFIRLGLRTGDTDARERARLRRRPPHLLLTTPESLAILLAQPAWHPALARCRFVILDELHALAESKRGAHLSVSLERLERMRNAECKPELATGQGARATMPSAGPGSPLVCHPERSEARAQSKDLPTSPAPASLEDPSASLGMTEKEKGDAIPRSAGSPSPLDPSQAPVRTPHSLVRIGLSATVGAPETVAAFLVGAGRECFLALAQTRREAVLETFSPLRDNPFPPPGGSGPAILRETARRVRAGRSTLVFANTRSGAERFGLALRGALPALADLIEIHHGSLDRSVRLEVEDRLKAGELRAVVCSTSLEMGIDIGAVDAVVMLSAPKSVARTLQRVGRSGHSVHAVSQGVLMARNVPDLVECAVTARLARAGRLEAPRIPENAADVLAQHIIGLAMGEPGIAVDEAFNVVRGAFPFRNLPRAEFDRVVEYLEGGGRSLARQYSETFGKIARRPNPETAEPGLWTTGRRVERDYLVNVGTIASEGVVSVVLKRRRRRPLGTVDERFVQSLRRGDVFVLGGDTLRFLETDAHGAAVVEPAAPGERPTVPIWSSSRQGLRGILATELAALRTDLDDRMEHGTEDTAAAWLAAHLEIEPANARAVVRQFGLQRRVSVVPRTGRMVVELFRETLVPGAQGARRGRGALVPTELSHYFFHTLIGRAGNDALSRIVARRVGELAGGNALAAADDYGFLLTLERAQELPPETWRERCFARADAEMELAAALKDSELVRGQFRSVAQTGLMVPRRLPGAERRLQQVRFSAEILFRVLGQHEPDHPLLAEAYRQATHGFLDRDGATAFLDRLEAERWDWRFVTLPAVSPFSFGLYSTRMKESLQLEDPDAAIERLYQRLQDV